MVQMISRGSDAYDLSTGNNKVVPSESGKSYDNIGLKQKSASKQADIIQKWMHIAQSHELDG